jgi:large subunit ribosomal protein L9
MEVILLRDIPKVGKKYDVKKVSDGYGMNYLLRQGFAEVATPQKISALSAKKEMNKATDQLQGELLKKALKELDGQKIHLTTKANEQGHLFKGRYRTSDKGRAQGAPSARDDRT